MCGSFMCRKFLSWAWVMCLPWAQKLLVESIVQSSQVWIRNVSLLISLRSQAWSGQFVHKVQICPSMALTYIDLQFAVLGLITFQQNIDLLIDLAASSDHGGLQDFATVLWMLCNGKVSRNMTALLVGNLDSDWYKLYYFLQCLHVDGKNHPI